MDIRTYVTVVTQPMNGRPAEQTIEVSELAQKHVLRKFNVTNSDKVDVTKVLCAALIQQMIDLRDAPGTPGYMKAAATIGIRHVENAQMHCVKANFVEA